MEWFRMYGEFATDPKVQMMSEADQRRFVMLLCLRCSNDDVTLHETEIAFQLRISDEEWSRSKALFLIKGLIDEECRPVKWDSRQFVSDSSAARVAAHRAKKKQARNVTVTPPDTDTDTDTEEKHNVDAERQPGDDDQNSEKPSTIPPCPYQKILDLYHAGLPELPAVVLLNDLRKKHLAARWRENPVHQDLQFWADYFFQVKQSRFLLGQAEGRQGSKPFRATFDWLIAPSNFVKVIEGNYNA
ncbi:hypothetical protein [Pseudomonas gingeri]|uniref:hypothetical protein n=1 Tax=Pseudomonas gingeri TaxID=117681 RepID=UPI0034E979B7